MASQPEISPGDIDQPQSPTETPPAESPMEEPGTDIPEIAPGQGDRDDPGGSPMKSPAPLE